MVNSIIISRYSLFLRKQKINSVIMHVMFHRLAIKHLSEIDGWSMEQLIAIIDKAKIVWSQSVNDWDKDQVSELGKVLSKLFMCLVIDLQLTPIPANKI